jgi:hypothetical protein
MRRQAATAAKLPVPESTFLVDSLVFVVFVVAGAALLFKLLMPPAGGGAASGNREGGNTSGGDTAGEDDLDKNASAFDLWLQNNAVLTASATYFLALVTGFQVSALAGESAADTAVGSVVGGITGPRSRLRQIVWTVIELALFALFVFEFSPAGSTNWGAIAAALFAFVAGLIWRLRRAQRLWRKVIETRDALKKGENKEEFEKAKKRLVSAAQGEGLRNHLDFYVGKLEFLVRVKRLAPFLISAKLTDLKASLKEVEGYINLYDNIPKFDDKTEKELIDDLYGKNEKATTAVDTAIAVNHVYFDRPSWSNRLWRGGD